MCRVPTKFLLVYRYYALSHIQNIMAYVYVYILPSVIRL